MIVLFMLFLSEEDTFKTRMSWEDPKAEYHKKKKQLQKDCVGSELGELAKRSEWLEHSEQDGERYRRQIWDKNKIVFHTLQG